MNVPLPLWITLILLSGYGNVLSYGDEEEEEESTTTYYETSVTPTPDYDYDYNATFDYYYVNATQIVFSSTEIEQSQRGDFRPDTRSLDVDKESSEGNRVRRVGPVDQSLIISTLLASLAALLH